uniref:Uncharacterized protein n=1 Tax=uncultured Planctomycetota bacterium TaxID=120965 RepID=A0A1B0Z234_9BACT|nr:hypothetical protein [uncultured Planctomycetota bacterium]
MIKQDAEAVRKEKILQFVDLFAMQNWRHRRYKDGDEEVRRIERFEVWHDALGLFREKSFDELFDDALKDKHASTKIAEAIAKSMLMDEYDFEQACKYFWFPVEKYEPLRAKVEKLIPVMANREDAKHQINEWDGMKVKRSDKPTGESMIEVDVDGKEKPVKVEIPDRLIDVAHLAEKLPFHEQKKPKRVGVNMRMRTDCSEILKLSAAASDMSVTQFVEQLALVHASSLVRSHTATFQQDDKRPREVFRGRLVRVVVLWRWPLQRQPERPGPSRRESSGRSN